MLQTALVCKADRPLTLASTLMSSVYIQFITFYLLYVHEYRQSIQHIKHKQLSLDTL